jgi:6-phosphogluconolactonase
MTLEGADRIVAAAKEAIAMFDRFTLFLSGGSTPKPLYQLLAGEDYADQIQWSKVEVFFCDERCVPADHKDSNYRMIAEALLTKVPLPRDNIYRMKGELEPNDAAKEYGLMLKEKFADSGPDYLLLGMGEDGHTASLFPGTAVLEEKKHRCMAQFVENSTTGESWRITLTAPFINTARDILVMTAGVNKAPALQQVLEGVRNPRKYPLQLIEPAQGHMTYLIDVKAAGMEE